MEVMPIMSSGRTTEQLSDVKEASTSSNSSERMANEETQNVVTTSQPLVVNEGVVLEVAGDQVTQQRMQLEML